MNLKKELEEIIELSEYTIEDILCFILKNYHIDDDKVQKIMLDMENGRKK